MIGLPMDSLTTRECGIHRDNLGSDDAMSIEADANISLSPIANELQPTTLFDW